MAKKSTNGQYLLRFSTEQECRSWLAQFSSPSIWDARGECRSATRSPFSFILCFERVWLWGKEREVQDYYERCEAEGPLFLLTWSLTEEASRQWQEEARGSSLTPIIVWCSSRRQRPAQSWELSRPFAQFKLKNLLRSGRRAIVMNGNSEDRQKYRFFCRREHIPYQESFRPGGKGLTLLNERAKSTIVRHVLKFEVIVYFFPDKDDLNLINYIGGSTLRGQKLMIVSRETSTLWERWALYLAQKLAWF